MRFILTVCFTVVVLLILTTRLLTSYRPPSGPPPANAPALQLPEALRQELAAAARTGQRAPVLPALPPVLPRDPFAFQPPAAPRRTPLPAASPPPAAAPLRLQATILDRHGALAFINGTLVREGDTLLGYTVVRIAEGIVELAGHGTRLTLRLEEGGEQ
ncbi:MAG: hypothetical protein KatS3mg131_0121 [Candidatus Tectimicrobiota bacterium]|nr:MAG: hypothetical protein KatS3mg131_0121 [Candidatus Tectomicrobia bacterium]